MIVEHLHRVRPHQRRRHKRRRRAVDDLGEFGDALPVAIIVEKAPAFARFQVLGGIGARLAHVVRDTGPDRFDMILEQSANHDGAVALIGVDIGFCH